MKKTIKDLFKLITAIATVAGILYVARDQIKAIIAKIKEVSDDDFDDDFDDESFDDDSFDGISLFESVLDLSPVTLPTLAASATIAVCENIPIFSVAGATAPVPISIAAITTATVFFIPFFIKSTSPNYL